MPGTLRPHVSALRSTNISNMTTLLSTPKPDSYAKSRKRPRPSISPLDTNALRRRKQDRQTQETDLETSNSQDARLIDECLTRRWTIPLTHSGLVPDMKKPNTESVTSNMETKIAYVESLLAALDILNNPDKLTGVHETTIHKISSIINSIATEIDERNKRAKNVIIYNFSDKTETKVAKRFLLKAAGMPEIPCICTRLRKKYVNHTCPIRITFDSNLNATQFLSRLTSTLIISNKGKRLVATKDKTPLERMVNKTKLSDSKTPPTLTEPAPLCTSVDQPPITTRVIRTQNDIITENKSNFVPTILNESFTPTSITHLIPPDNQNHYIKSNSNQPSKTPLHDSRKDQNHSLTNSQKPTKTNLNDSQKPYVDSTFHPSIPLTLASHRLNPNMLKQLNSTTHKQISVDLDSNPDLVTPSPKHHKLFINADFKHLATLKHNKSPSLLGDPPTQLTRSNIHQFKKIRNTKSTRNSAHLLSPEILNPSHTTTNLCTSRMGQAEASSFHNPYHLYSNTTKHSIHLRNIKYTQLYPQYKTQPLSYYSSLHVSPTPRKKGIFTMNHSIRNSYAQLARNRTADLHNTPNYNISSQSLIPCLSISNDEPQTYQNLVDTHTRTTEQCLGNNTKNRNTPTTTKQHPNLTFLI